MPDETMRPAGLTPGQLDQVASALHGTGFILEHRVHQAFTEHGMNAFLGFLYTDPETSEEREMDIVVRDHQDIDGLNGAVWHSVIAECKSWQNPVVVIGNPRRTRPIGRVFDEARCNPDVLSERATELRGTFGGMVSFLQFRNLPASSERCGFIGNQMVLLERQNGKYRANNSGVFKSTVTPVAKVMKSEQDELTRATDTVSTHTKFVISYPVVITSGPVLEAEPTGSELAVREVPWTRVLRRFKDDGLPGSVIVEVIQEDSLGTWLDQRYDAFRLQTAERISQGLAALGGQDAPSRQELVELQRKFTT